MIDRHLLANTLRGLAMDGVQKANSGHPGMPMGMADVAAVLWTGFLKHDPADPAWLDRDRFVLSAGHGSMLLYGLLHLSGYEDFPMEELQRFRQWGSRTAGHPESHLSRAIETTTGPLGQGISNAVGMALAERWLAERFNRPDHEVVGHHTWVIAGDGDLMEGVASEACSLAGHLGLGRLIVLYDDNGITIDGKTDLAFSEDVATRFYAYGWHVQHVNGHDHAAIEAAIAAARDVTDRPSLLCCKTHIGFGSPNKQDTSSCHGSPLGDAEIALTKDRLGWPQEPRFHVPDAIRKGFDGLRKGWAETHASWRRRFADYADSHPALAAQLQQQMQGRLPEGWTSALPSFAEGTKLATREASGQVINALAPVLPALLGGSADLAGSNNTDIKGGGSVQRRSFGGRNLHFGVREHGMGAICNGLALHGGVIPYDATFLVFSDYMRGAIRLSALMRQRVIHILTHDSVFLGEDGPTHQPVEHLAALRCIPGLTVLRPGDANEVAAAWAVALGNEHGPSALALTRQKVPTLEGTAERAREGVARGAYVLVDTPRRPDLLLLATGSELHVAVGAAALLAERGVAARVVSFPSWELFAAQSRDYQAQVLPADVPVRVVVEAGVRMGWERWAGSSGSYVTIETFGHSAPAEVIAEKLGFTAAQVAEAADRALRGE
ncbi:MAG: transketolase [Myxococcales bacterium]